MKKSCHREVVEATVAFQILHLEDIRFEFRLSTDSFLWQKLVQYPQIGLHKHLKRKCNFALFSDCSLPVSVRCYVVD